MPVVFEKRGFMKKLLPLLILHAVFFLYTGCDTGSGGGSGIDVWEREDPDKWAGVRTGKWTVMVWLDGDNNLEAASLLDFNEMEYGLYLAEQGNSNINNELAVIVQIDRVPGYVNIGLDGGPDWTNTRRYRISSDPDTGDDMIRSYQLANMDETNMGSAANLRDFITYCKSNYPADNYALILWNHGGGVRGSSTETIISKSISKSGEQIEPVYTPKAVCWDETNSNDCLYVGEISDVLTDAEDVDLLGFDACLMGMAEVAYQFRSGTDESTRFSADYMAASVANEQGDGWEYNRIFNRFSGSGTDPEGDTCESVSDTDASDFATIIVKEYSDAFAATPAYAGETMAAYNLNMIEAVKTQLDSLASGLGSSKTASDNARDSSIHYFDDGNTYEWISNPHFDLYDYAINMGESDLASAVSACVVSSWGNSYSGFSPGNSGLGFFYPDGDITYDSYSIYAYQWWYTEEDTNSWWTGHYYGKLDFCDSDSDGIVETWRELLEKWYDPSNSYTPGSY